MDAMDIMNTLSKTTDRNTLTMKEGITMETLDKIYYTLADLEGEAQMGRLPWDEYRKQIEPLKEEYNRLMEQEYKPEELWKDKCKCGLWHTTEAVQEARIR